MEYASANAKTDAPELRSQSLLGRLSHIRMSLKELNASTDSAAEKIVGSAPTPIGTNISGGAGLLSTQAEKPPASCFLDALAQAVDDLERIVEGDLRNNVNRFHRFF